MDKRVLKYFGCMQEKAVSSVARRVLMTEASERRVRGRPRLCWMDGLKVTMDSIGKI